MGDRANAADGVAGRDVPRLDSRDGGLVVLTLTLSPSCDGGLADPRKPVELLDGGRADSLLDAGTSLAAAFTSLFEGDAVRLVLRNEVLRAMEPLAMDEVEEVERGIEDVGSIEALGRGMADEVIRLSLLVLS